ncbi:SDR family oxidoreductase [Trinickia sp. LjRoot230]|uniref:SDR family NAD(P)-dependent oxidoreductase n=1 Tax=Trinickia sp. LjRoot230 TaxID=3342288 RepID=UPI003ECEFAD3
MTRATRVAIVTGASRGIGAAIATRLAADGMRVFVHYRDAAFEAEARSVVARIEAAGGVARALPADLREPGQIRDLVAAVIREAGQLDVLINNAAIYDKRPLSDIDVAHIDEHFNVNLRGPLIATQVAAQHLRSGGRIVYVGSGLARRIAPGCSIYAATKAALEAVARCQAAELGPRGITVNAIAPGIVDTAMLARVLSTEDREALIRNTALGRIGEPDDIARVVAFMVSADAAWISGQVIDADGGLA